MGVPQPASSGGVLPGGVIGNTRDFGSLVLGSSPSRVAPLSQSDFARRIETASFDRGRTWIDPPDWDC